MTSAVRRRVAAAAVVVVLAWAGVACGTDGPGTATERGERVYAANCAQCHGDDLGGTERGPSLLLDAYGPGQLTDAAMADAIRNGVEQRLFEFGPMAGNGALGDEQIDAVIAVVRAEQSAATAG